MSIGLMEKMFMARLPSANVKIVAVRLADFADIDGCGVWPSLGRVALECGLSKATVRRALKTLVDELRILVLVRDGGQGPGSTNRYDFNMVAVAGLSSVHKNEDADSETSEKGCHGDTLNPDAKGISQDHKGISQDHKGIVGDTQTVNNRNNRQSQDADAREREDDLKVDDEIDHKAVEKAFRRSFFAWPGHLTDSEVKARVEWGRLTPDEMVAAEAGIEQFLAQNKADGRKFVIAFGTFIKEKRWVNLPKIQAKPDASKGWALPFGTDWGIVRFKHLLGPADNSGRWGWVEQMQSRARRGMAIRCVEKPLELKQMMEFVSVDYDMWEIWKREHDAQKWPWFIDVGQRRGAWFPKGGPDGLEAFKAALDEFYQPVKKTDERSVGLGSKGAEAPAALERSKKGAAA